MRPSSRDTWPDRRRGHRQPPRGPLPVRLRRLSCGKALFPPWDPLTKLVTERSRIDTGQRASLAARGLADPSPPRAEVLQARRRLILLGWPDKAILVQEVCFITDANRVALPDARVLVPLRLRVRGAPVVLQHRPGPRQRMVEDRDLVMQEVLVGLVEEDALFDDRLIVLVQRNSAQIEIARSLEAAGFDLQHVVAAVLILVDPLTDGIAIEAFLDLPWPVTAVGVNAPTGFADIINRAVGNVW